jgi:hypothetical protein
LVWFDWFASDETRLGVLRKAAGIFSGKLLVFCQETAGIFSGKLLVFFQENCWYFFRKAAGIFSGKLLEFFPH